MECHESNSVAGSTTAQLPALQITFHGQQVASSLGGGGLTSLYRCPRGVMVKAMNCGIVVREFVLQSRYYIHFRANTLGKGMNPLILPPAMGK